MTTLVSELMRPPVTVADDAQLGLVEAELRIADVRHLLVVDAAGALAGIVSRGDVMRAQAKAEHSFVRDVMTRRIFTLRPDAPAAFAIDVLIERGVGAVPIIDGDGKPVGIVAEVDCLKLARKVLAG